MISKFVLLLFSICLLSQCKKTAAIQEEQTKGPIYSLDSAYNFQYEAMAYYNKDARKSANAFLRATEAYLQNGSKKDAGICISNAARLYEEQFMDIDSALLLAQKGLDYSIEANDTLNKGHGYRYTGFLIGISSTNLEEAKSRIEKSKGFYMMRNFKDAVAVADYDMARVYYKHNMFEQADEKLKISTDHFKNTFNLPRIFNNNLFGLRLYKDSNNQNMYNQAKSENESLSTNEKISPELKQKFKEILNRN